MDSESDSDDEEQGQGSGAGVGASVRAVLTAGRLAESGELQSLEWLDADCELIQFDDRTLLTPWCGSKGWGPGPSRGGASGGHFS